MARLLASAESILASEGYEALSVRRLAAEAQVPVGTLYQFFSDKDAVVDALALRYLGEFAELMAALVEASSEEHWTDLVDRVFDSFVEGYRARPGYVRLWLGRFLGPEIRRADDANNELLAEGLRRILLAQEDLVDDDRLLQCCRVAVHIGDAMLQLAFRTDPGGDPAVIEEAKVLQRLYRREVVSRCSS